MNERKFELTEINTAGFFGVNNVNFKIIKKHFPKLKIVARGDVIRTYGEIEVIDEFEKRLQMLVDYYSRYNSIDKNSIERLILTNGDAADEKGAKIKDLILFGVKGRAIKAITDNHRKMVASMKKNDMLFAVGPAGTGKTYTAVAIAVNALKNKEVRRIILTRPAVEAGENLGFLPGDLKEKLDPYMQPLYDALRDMIPFEKLELYIETGVIQIAPLAFMRGRTLDESYVILDEAQNTTHNQMKMFLTRMGKNAKFIITGDPGQIDLPKKQISGLKEAILVLQNVPGISIVQLDGKDVMRHNLVKKIVKAFQTIETS